MVTTVTRDGWSVSTTFPAGRNGYRLNVRKHMDPACARHRKGDHDGRFFWTGDEATAFALERGYLQRHVRTGHATLRKRNRRVLRELHAANLRAILTATPGDTSWLAERADFVRALIASLPGGDPLIGTTWSAGFWRAVHRLRPELLARAA